MGRTRWVACLLAATLSASAWAAPPQSDHPGDKFSSDQPLGAIYSAQATTFRVFAPTAHQVTMNLYPCPSGGKARTQVMQRASDGTWSVTLPGDLRGHYYTYSASGSDPGFDPHREVPDPYSECVTAADGRSLIVDDQTPVAPRPSFPKEEAIIYEMHLRDFTIDPDSGVQQRGKYLGLTEAGRHLTGFPQCKTGLDHLSELGINTVQILPFSEFASDEVHDQYGWGYDAALYFTPDGWYSSQALDGSRVREAKQMIDALHRRGIRVVMDVVYNHTEDSLRRRAGSLEALAPGYYYRRRPDGSYFNGSGCGNEIRSEAPMARRLIKDSLKHWVRNYKVDGFRFDLLGLMDAQTVTEATRELLEIEPGLIIYGEPWAAGETPIQVTSKGAQKGLGFGVFNDNFRDSLKGSVFKPEERGFVQNGDHVEAIRRGIAGSIDDFASAPGESINYVECHDNHTFWDRLVLSTRKDGKIREADRQRMDRLGAAILLTSQGIPFFQSGQEMLRSKNFDDNSFDKPDAVNMIRWSQKHLHRDIFNYYRGLIELRKAHPMFRLARAEQVRKALRFLPNVPDQVIAYTLTWPGDSWSSAAVFLNASGSPKKIPLPPGKWSLFVDDLRAGNQPLVNSSVRLNGREFLIPPRCAVVLGQLRS